MERIVCPVCGELSVWALELVCPNDDDTEHRETVDAILRSHETVTETLRAANPVCWACGISNCRHMH